MLFAHTHGLNGRYEQMSLPIAVAWPGRQFLSCYNLLNLKFATPRVLHVSENLDQQDINNKVILYVIRHLF